jgi:hypothetical protein
LTDPRPPPNDEELRWKSRQRYSDDSGSESDDEQHLPGLRYHQQQQRPNLSQYVSDGCAPGTGGSGGDGSSHGLSNIKTVHLEPLVKSSQVATDLAVRPSVDPVQCRDGEFRRLPTRRRRLIRTASGSSTKRKFPFPSSAPLKPKPEGEIIK